MKPTRRSGVSLSNNLLEDDMLKGPQQKDDEAQQQGYAEAEAQAEKISDALDAGAPAEADLIPVHNVPNASELNDDVVLAMKDERVPNMPDHVNADIEDVTDEHVDDGSTDGRETALTSADLDTLRDAYSRNEPDVDTRD